MTVHGTEHKTLLQFLLDLLRDPHAREAFQHDPRGALHAAGLDGVTPGEIRDAMPLVLDHCPPHVAAEWERMDRWGRDWDHHRDGGHHPGRPHQDDHRGPEHDHRDHVCHPGCGHDHDERHPRPVDHECHPGCGCGDDDGHRHPRWWDDHGRHHEGWHDGWRDGWHHVGWGPGRWEQREWWEHRDAWGGHPGHPHPVHPVHPRPVDHECHPGCGCDDRRAHDRHDRHDDRDHHPREHHPRPDEHHCHPGCGCGNDHGRHHGDQGSHDYEYGKVVQQLNYVGNGYHFDPHAPVFTRPFHPDAFTHAPEHMPWSPSRPDHGTSHDGPSHDGPPHGSHPGPSAGHPAPGLPGVQLPGLGNLPGFGEGAPQPAHVETPTSVPSFGTGAPTSTTTSTGTTTPTSGTHPGGTHPVGTHPDAPDITDPGAADLHPSSDSTHPTHPSHPAHPTHPTHPSHPTFEHHDPQPAAAHPVDPALDPSAAPVH